MMIFYYSGSGNSETVARSLSEDIGTDLVEIPSAVSRGRLRYDAHGGPVGFAVPVYFRGLPRIVESFCGTLEVVNPGFVFAVLTCSGDSGRAGEDLQAALSDRLRIDACYDILMPDSAPFINGAGLADGSGEHDGIPRISRGISAREKGDFRRFDTSRSNSEDRERYLGLSDTSNFSVTGACSSCKMCAQYCPEQIIRFYSFKPVWDEPCCSLCMRCVNICPRKAVRFGGKDNGDRYLSDIWKRESHDYIVRRLHQKIPPMRRCGSAFHR
ncbi:MAG: EFR1 family ferrodoxin, partial [Candidatus Methanomethylophilaceae archaeon]|nr:EFR1 family ferrodoxin [Candidatus Methanomethylophilaceae archaeon]